MSAEDLAAAALGGVARIMNVEIPALKFAGKEQIPIISKIVDVSIPYRAKNADAPLVIPTETAGGQQPTHPSVVYFPEGWNGWKYWMAHTPFPLGQPASENPHIVVSQDGINWENPTGITNPIFGGLTIGYYSDVDLIYLPQEDKLCLFWRWADSPDKGEIYYVSFSSDGITWSPREVSLTSFSEFMLSASIVYDGKKYHMWYLGSFNLSVPITPLNSTVRYRVADSPLGPWSTAVDTSLSGLVLGNNDVAVWHLDVNKYGEEYHMFICASDSNLYLATSQDKLNWKVTKNAILAKSGVGTGKFDAAKIYRSSGILVQEGTGYRYKIWYGAVNAADTWTIGYTELILGPSSLIIKPKTPTEQALLLEGLTNQTVPLLEINARNFNQRVMNLKFNGEDRLFYSLGEGLRMPVDNDQAIFGNDGAIKLRINPSGNIVHLQAGASETDEAAKIRIARYKTGANIAALEVYADVGLFKGDVELDNLTKGVILKAPDASRWRVQVGNDGVLKTTKL